MYDESYVRLLRVRSNRRTTLSHYYYSLCRARKRRTFRSINDTPVTEEQFIQSEWRDEREPVVALRDVSIIH